jgi:hypothetical protein
MQVNKKVSGKCPTCQKKYTYLVKEIYMNNQDMRILLSCPHCENVVEETFYGKRKS